MQRENRYIVFKHKDLEAAEAAGFITPGDAWALQHVAGKIALYRHCGDKQPLECVVVESDWPEYEPVWAMIEARVDGKEDDPDDLKELLTFYSVSTVKDLVAEMKKHVEQLVARVYEKPFQSQRVPREG